MNPQPNGPAALPPGQERLIVGATGRPFSNPDKLGQLVSEWRDRLGIRRSSGSTTPGGPR